VAVITAQIAKIEKSDAITRIYLFSFCIVSSRAIISFSDSGMPRLTHSSTHPHMP